MNLVLTICDIFIKRKYNRSRVPLEEGVISCVDQLVNANVPIKLVAFWGAADKITSGPADEKSCLFFVKLNEEIKNIYPPGIEFTFIFATKHAEHNGYDKNGVDLYIQSIIKLFDRYSFKYVFLDDLWGKYQISFEKVDSILTTKTPNWWNSILEKDSIEEKAGRRNKKYDITTAAQKYYIMRDLEKDMLQKEFKGSIFHAFADPTMKQVLPNMPTLYFWGTEKWRSDAPWFMK